MLNLFNSVYLYLIFSGAIAPVGGIDIINNKYLCSETMDYIVGFEVILIINDFIYIGGGLDTYTENAARTIYDPKVLDSWAYIKIHFDWMNITYTHRCIHPILAWKIGESINKYYEAWYEELKIEFIAKIEIINKK